jgi:hypothetical protein
VPNGFNRGISERVSQYNNGILTFYGQRIDIDKGPLH